MATALYRAWSSAGELLYIGISDSPWQRFTQHAGDKPWWPQVAHLDVEWYPAREIAEQAERDAIRAEFPRHNTRHVITREQLIALEEARAAWATRDRLLDSAWKATQQLRDLGVPDLAICEHIRQVSKPTLNRKLGPRKAKEA